MAELALLKEGLKYAPLTVILIVGALLMMRAMFGHNRDIVRDFTASLNNVSSAIRDGAKMHSDALDKLRDKVSECGEEIAELRGENHGRRR